MPPGSAACRGAQNHPERYPYPEAPMIGGCSPVNHGPGRGALYAPVNSSSWSPVSAVSSSIRSGSSLRTLFTRCDTGRTMR